MTDGFGPAEWRVVCDTTPIGHERTRKRYSGWLDIASLGGINKAERLGAGRINFLSACGSRLGVAVRVLDEYEAGNASHLDVAAGFGPFMTLVSPTSVGLSGDILELWNDGRRRQLLVDIVPLLDVDASVAGRRSRGPTALPDTLERTELAICLESVRRSLPGQHDLGAWYIELCRFSDAAREGRHHDEGMIQCQKERLVWLGYEAGDAKVVFSTGKEAIRMTRQNTDFLLAVASPVLVWSSIGLGLLVFAGMITSLALLPASYVAVGIGLAIGRLASRDTVGPTSRTWLRGLAIAIAWLLPFVVVYALWIGPGLASASALLRMNTSSVGRTLAP